jgi:hypothetical protein
MNNLIKEARAGRIEPLSALAWREAPAVEGMASRTAKQSIGATNRFIKEAGARSWGKPLLYGLAATAGIAMLMGGPSPQPMTPPPAAAKMGQGMQSDLTHASQTAAAHLRGITPSERDLRPENIPVPDGITGRPTAPGMMSPSTYMTQSQGMGRRSGYTYAITARSGRMGMPDRRSLAGTINQVVPGSRVNINIRDFRQRMTSQRINDMLGGF